MLNYSSADRTGFSDGMQNIFNLFFLLNIHGVQWSLFIHGSSCYPKLFMIADFYLNHKLFLPLQAVKVKIQDQYWTFWKSGILGKHMRIEQGEKPFRNLA